MCCMSSCIWRCTIVPWATRINASRLSDQPRILPHPLVWPTAFIYSYQFIWNIRLCLVCLLLINLRLVIIILTLWITWVLIKPLLPTDKSRGELLQWWRFEFYQKGIISCTRMVSLHFLKKDLPFSILLLLSEGSRMASYGRYAPWLLLCYCSLALYNFRWSMCNQSSFTERKGNKMIESYYWNQRRETNHLHGHGGRDLL